MAVMTGTAYLEKQQFLDNFWADWKPILGKGHVIQSLKKCDFTPIYEWHMAERERKKALPKEVRPAVWSNPGLSYRSRPYVYHRGVLLLCPKQQAVTA